MALPSNSNPAVEQLREQAESLAHSGRWDEAIHAWHQLEELSPHDLHAADEAARLIVARARRRVGLDGNDPTHEDDHPPTSGDTSILPSQRMVVAQRIVAAVPLPALPSGSRDHGRSALQQFEHAWREFPSNPEIVLHLARLYLEADREYDAERLLAKSFDITDKDPRVQMAQEEVIMLRLEQKVTHARNRVAEEPTNETKQALADVLAEQDRAETRIFRARCDRNPNNAGLLLELGRRLERGGKPIDAARYFSKAADDPVHGPAAAWEAGRCCQQLGEYPEALQFYRRAAEGARCPGQENAGIAALLAAAELAHELKMDLLAKRYLCQLLSLSPGHADAEGMLTRLG